MEIKTGNEIYEEILEYADVNGKHKWCNVKWIKLKDVQEELEDHLKHYKGTKIANFINSFLYGLEI